MEIEKAQMEKSQLVTNEIADPKKNSSDADSNSAEKKEENAAVKTGKSVSEEETPVENASSIEKKAEESTNSLEEKKENVAVTATAAVIEQSTGQTGGESNNLAEAAAGKSVQVGEGKTPDGNPDSADEAAVIRPDSASALHIPLPKLNVEILEPEEEDIYYEDNSNDTDEGNDDDLFMTSAGEIHHAASIILKKSTEKEDVWKHLYLEYEADQYLIRTEGGVTFSLRPEQRKELKKLQDRLLKYLNTPIEEIDPTKNEGCWAGPMFKWDKEQELLVYITAQLQAMPILFPDLRSLEDQDKGSPRKSSSAIKKSTSESRNEPRASLTQKMESLHRSMTTPTKTRRQSNIYDTRRLTLKHTHAQSQKLEKVMETLLSDNELKSLSSMSFIEAQKRFYKKLKPRFSQHLSRRRLHPDDKMQINNFLLSRSTCERFPQDLVPSNRIHKVSVGAGALIRPSQRRQATVDDDGNRVIAVSVCHAYRNLYFSFDAIESNTIGQLKENLQKVGGYLYGNQTIFMDDNDSEPLSDGQRFDELAGSFDQVTLYLEDAHDIKNQHLFNPDISTPGETMRARRSAKQRSLSATDPLLDVRNMSQVQSLLGIQKVFFSCPPLLLRIKLESGNEYPLDVDHMTDLFAFRANPPCFGPLRRLTGEALQKKREEKVPDFSDIFQSQLRIAKDALDSNFMFPPEGVIFRSERQSKLSGEDVYYCVPPSIQRLRFEVRRTQVFFNTRITRYLSNLLLIDKMPVELKEKYRKAFDLCDADGNGMLSAEEIKTRVLPLLKLDNDDLTKNLLADASLDGDNELSVAEFMIFIERNRLIAEEKFNENEGQPIQLSLTLAPIYLAWYQYGVERTGTVILNPDGSVYGQGAVLGLNFWHPTDACEFVLSMDVEAQFNVHVLHFNESFTGFSCNRGIRGYLLRSCATSPDDAFAPARDSSYMHDQNGPRFRCMTSLEFQSNENVPVTELISMADNPPPEASMDPGTIKRKYTDMLAQATANRDNTCSSFAAIGGFTRRVCRKCGRKRHECEAKQQQVDEEVIRITTRWKSMQKALRARHVAACVLREEPHVSEIKELCNQVTYQHEISENVDNLAEDMCAAALQTIRSDLLPDFINLISEPRVWFQDLTYQRKCCEEAIKLARAPFLLAIFRLKYVDFQAQYLAGHILELSAATSQTPLSPLEEYNWDNTLLMLAVGLAKTRMSAVDPVVAEVIVHAAQRQLLGYGVQDWSVRLAVAEEEATLAHKRSLEGWAACEAFLPIGKRKGAAFLETLLFDPLVKIYASGIERKLSDFRTRSRKREKHQMPRHSGSYSSFSLIPGRDSSNNENASPPPPARSPQNALSKMQSAPAMIKSKTRDAAGAAAAIVSLQSKKKKRLTADPATANLAHELLDVTVLPRMKQVLQLQIDHAESSIEVLKEVYIKRHTMHRKMYLNTLRQLEDIDFHEFNDLANKICHICKENLDPTKVTQSESGFIDVFVSAHEVDTRFRKFMKKLQTKTLGEYTPVPVKGMHRALEKTGLRTDNKQWNADNICDCVRGAVVYGDMRTMRTMLCLMAAACTDPKLRALGQKQFGDAASAGIHEKINILRVKNRFAKPTSGGWADANVSFVFVDDPVQHVVEVQLVHRNLFNVRKEMGAHKGYAEFRSAMELLEANDHCDIIEECDNEHLTEDEESVAWRMQKARNSLLPTSVSEAKSLQERVHSLEEALEDSRKKFQATIQQFKKQLGDNRAEIRKLRRMLTMPSVQRDTNSDFRLSTPRTTAIMEALEDNSKDRASLPFAVPRNRSAVRPRPSRGMKKPRYSMPHVSPGSVLRSSGVDSFNKIRKTATSRISDQTGGRLLPPSLPLPEIRAHSATNSGSRISPASQSPSAHSSTSVSPPSQSPRVRR